MHLNYFDIIQIIYRLIFANKSNKYYADETRLSLIRKLCDKIKIGYRNILNGIEIFVLPI